MRRLVIVIGSLGLVAVLASSGTSGEIISECGEVDSNYGCRFFYPFWPSAFSPYVLPDSPYVADGTECEITGEVDYDSEACPGSGYYDYRLKDITVRPCVPQDLGCGVLRLFSEEYGCYTWTPLGDPQGAILVDGHDGFGAGDTVNAMGIRADYPDIRICGCGVLLHSSLAPCADTTAATSAVTWGRLKAIFHE